MNSLHQNQRVLLKGSDLETAQSAMILVHGRGASAASILPLGEELGQDKMSFLAPQADDSTWYPYSFLAPIEMNEPGISNGIETIKRLVEDVEAAGIPAEKIILAGFSQGACLTLEFAARHARRYGAILGFSGGLIGPDDSPRDYAGSLEGTPVFLGCSEHDPHIPQARVVESATVLERLGAEVTLKLYAGNKHSINDDEVELTRAIVEKVHLA